MMTKPFKTAKIDAKTAEEDWRDHWKYGDILRGVGLAAGEPTFDWGPGATQEQKDLIADAISSPTKWASRVEDLLDNPPTDAERAALRMMKRFGRR